MNKQHVIALVIALLLSGPYLDRAIAQPLISDITGIIAHGSEVSINGSGFGSKPESAPYRSSFMSADPSQSFQSTGTFSSTYWSLVSSVMISLQDDLRRVNRPSHRYYARLEYSERGNWGAGGYTAGIQVPFSGYERLYMSWWEYYVPEMDFSKMHTGNANIKWIYFAAGHSPAHAITVNQDGATMQGGAPNGVAGDTREEQDANLLSDYDIHFYGRPLSWQTAFAIPKGQWYFVELISKPASGSALYDGYEELRINNKRIYRANNLNDWGEESAASLGYANIRFGGNYGFEGPETYYRYYGDFYIDLSHARVVICDSSNYSACTRLEMQIPSSWSDQSITVNINQGAFQDGQTAYLYVFDNSNTLSAPVPIRLGPRDDTIPNAPENLRMQ